MKPVLAALICGCPQSGKTTKALELARQEALETGFPVLALDPGRVRQLEDIPEAESFRELVYAVWDRGTHSRICPESEESWNRVWTAIRKLGRCIVLVDEARFFVNAFKMSLPAVLATRVLNHLRVSIILTTQSYGDLPRSLSSVATELHVFRCTAPRDLERLREDYGLDPAEIAALPQYTCKVVKVGF